MGKLPLPDGAKPVNPPICVELGQIIKEAVREGSTVFTEEYNIYNNLGKAYGHRTVNHGRGEYARDEDGKCEVHVYTMECILSLPRP